MYTSGVYNDQFQVYQLTGYCNDGYVTNGTSSPGKACPFIVGSGYNNTFNGAEMVEIYSPVANECLGTNTSGQADLGPCPPAGGTGVGSNIWFETAGGCATNGYSSYLGNVYWINHENDGTVYYLLSGGSIGAQAYVTDYGGSCWGRLNQ